MIIKTNTGVEGSANEFCKCGNDYAGDRVIIQDSEFIPVLGGEYQASLNISSFFKNISQANIYKFKLASKQSKILNTDTDGDAVFIAISVVDPTKPIYWRKVYENPLFEYITAILNGSFKITTSPFVSDRVNATMELTLNSDNTFKTITWANIGTSFIDGQIADTWNNADYSWNDYHPLLTTNTKLTVVNSVTTMPFVIEQDTLGNYTGEVTMDISFGSTVGKVKIVFHGVYGTSFIVDSFEFVLDGHLVGLLYILPGTITTDFITTPLCMKVNYSFIASSGLLEEFDKIVGLMVLTSTDNEPIGTIKLYNGSLSAVQISTMIGSK